MDPIKSRRNILGFYMVTLFVFGLWILMAYSIFFAAEQKPPFLHVLAVLFAAMAVYTVLMCFKNAPIIYVDEKIIKFNNAIHYWSDIQKITLTGKQPYKYILNVPTEGMALKFIDGTNLYAFDHNYSNLWQIKLFIQNVIINKESFNTPSVERIDKNKTDHENFRYIKGNVFFSFRGVTTWFLPLFFLALLIFDKRGFNSDAIFPVIIFCILWLGGHSFFLYYFGVSENYLVIKNHNFFWIKAPIACADIKEVIFETRSRGPNCMRVVTKDFRTRLYPAGTLSDKKWRELLTKLRKNKVKVRNEMGI